MKSLLIPILLLALFSCNSLRNTSEVNDQYKPLKKFKPLKDAEIGSDTADYLTYNFITNKEKYIGKSFAAFMKDLKMSIVSIYFTPIYFDRKYCESIRLNFFIPEIRNRGVQYYLYINFKDKFIYSELDSIQIKDQDAWSESQFNYLKDKIIKDIVIADSRNWKKNAE